MIEERKYPILLATVIPLARKLQPLTRHLLRGTESRQLECSG